MKRRGVLASDPEARAAAEAALVDGGTAVAAILAGFFTAAAISPSVLLGPCAIIAGGVGRGVRVFDGRPRVPGLDGRRPRGTREGELVADAAYLAAPGSLAALSLAMLYQGASGLIGPARGGISLARRLGHTERAVTLETLAGAGVSGLRQPSIQKALLEAAGPAGGGTLTAADLDCRFTADFSAEAAEGRMGLPHFTEPAKAGVGTLHAVVAADGSGLLAALSYWVDPDAKSIATLGVSLPRLATPVRRGIVRSKPGSAIGVNMDVFLEGPSAHPEIVGATAHSGLLRLRQDPRTKEVTALAQTELIRG